jgi:hypothetical protein
MELFIGLTLIGFSYVRIERFEIVFGLTVILARAFGEDLINIC